MKTSLLSLVAVFVASSWAPAQTLLFNFHSTAAADTGPVAAPYLLTDPAHAIGGLSASDTTWNNFNTASPSSLLLGSDGSAATGVSVVFGGESAVGSGGARLHVDRGYSYERQPGFGRRRSRPAIATRDGLHLWNQHDIHSAWTP